MVDLGAADPGALNTAQGGWTLDPIDGTKGFLRGEQYCVSLALIREGRVERGFLGCPNLSPTMLGDPIKHGSGFGSRYWAADGRSHMVFETNKTLVEYELRHEHLLPNHAARLAESVETSHTRKDIAAEIMKLAGPVGEPVLMDSQCKYALLARGDADVYLRLPSKR